MGHLYSVLNVRIQFRRSWVRGPKPRLRGGGSGKQLREGGPGRTGSEGECEGEADPPAASLGIPEAISLPFGLCNCRNQSLTPGTQTAAFPSPSQEAASMPQGQGTSSGFPGDAGKGCQLWVWM